MHNVIIVSYITTEYVVKYFEGCGSCIFCMQVPN